MPPKRAATKPTTTTAAPAPVVNALLLSAAAAYGLWLLVARGRVSWPPHELLSSAYTVAGCLALVGPIVLARRDGGESGVGDLIWMTAGLMVWIFDLAALLRGELRASAWATPLAAPTLGLAMLAVLLAGLRCRSGGANWSWTNVTGWVLGLFWIGVGIAALVPGRTLIPSVR